MPFSADLNLFVFYRSESERSERVSYLFDQIIQWRIQEGFSLQDQGSDQIFLENSARQTEEWYLTSMKTKRCEVISCDHWFEDSLGPIRDFVQANAVDLFSVKLRDSGFVRRLISWSTRPTYFGRLTPLVVFFWQQSLEDSSVLDKPSAHENQTLLECSWSEIISESSVHSVASSAQKDFLTRHKSALEAAIKMSLDGDVKST
ncbi:MAG: hypothetical protein ABG776_09750 [Cyanobacteria bacterium J06555_13]